MTCDQISELLSDLLDGELADGARAGVEAHLAACERCAGEYRALRRTVRFVRANANAPLAAGTPGGAYMEFTRALVDDEYQRPPETVIAEDAAEIAPDQLRARNNFASRNGGRDEV